MIYLTQWRNEWTTSADSHHIKHGRKKGKTINNKRVKEKDFDAIFVL